MVDAAEPGMGDGIDALLAAIVWVGPPADIGKQAGRVTEAAFIRRLFEGGIGEKLIGPARKARTHARRSGTEARRNPRRS